MSSRRRPITTLLLAFLACITVAACSSTDASGAQEASDDAAGVDGDEVISGSSGEAENTTTTTLAPRAPDIDVPDSTFVEVGESISEAIVVDDANGDDTVVRIFEGSADGFDPITNVRGRVIGFEWEPSEPGEWDVVVTATDEGGLVGEETVRLIARNEPSIDMFYVMGDSIAAGFGRDRSDFTGGDECFRSEGDSYGTLAYLDLVSRNTLGPEAELLIVACADIEAADLGRRATVATDEDGDVVGEAQTQLARATELNPTIITLTVGALDIGLFDLEDVVSEDAGQDPLRALSDTELQSRVEEVRGELASSLEVLMTTTSAHVVMTTMYNPVASDPVGIDECSGECMVSVTTRMVDSLNDMLLSLAAEQPVGRMSVARLDGEADIWEAPNGAGLDALRDGLGPLQGAIDAFTGGSNALCADDSGVDDPLISSLDCAHPNDDGQAAIADVVIRSLLSI